MKNYKLKLIAVILFFAAFTGLQAQEALPATGGNASDSDGSVSYSVGQVVYTANSDATGSVSQGVQQGYEISAVSGLEEAKGINLVCSVYPNPTTDYLTLSIEDYDSPNLSYQLLDINGRFIEKQIVTEAEISISMIDLKTAVYFLKVLDGKQDIRTFKIVKN